MRDVNEIIVHCSATKPDWMKGRPTAEKVAEIRRWHVQDNGWADIGYHWIIDRDGTVMAGRPEAKAGAHTAGRNAMTIGICLLGGYGSNENDPFDKNFTVDQDRALRRLIRDICNRYGEELLLSGHNQYAAKACPGFNVPRWYQTSLVSREPDLPVEIDPVQGLAERIVNLILQLFGGKK